MNKIHQALSLNLTVTLGLAGVNIDTKGYKKGAHIMKNMTFDLTGKSILATQDVPRFSELPSAL